MSSIMPLKLGDTPNSPETAQPAGGSSALAPTRRLTSEDAVDIWIARWLRIRRKDILARYRCDPRRLYEIWWEERFAGSRERAEAVFKERYPGLADRVDFSRSRRLRRKPLEDLQGRLFD